ncbi:phosphatase 2C-like protein 44 [Cucumis melo var. makuwa]|nr:phosphatase 2C-like protein 44 [Cucumis melo var. makuwa]
MKKAHLSARTKVREAKEGKEGWKMGSSSALVIDGDKLVIATMGDYRTILCEDGLAHQISCDQDPTTQRWSSRLMFGMKPRKGSELVFATKRINSETEFVILGSNGIWEVMKNQEAVNLIRHMEDPQEAAECLAKEAFTRMSKSSISCLVIRFD